MQKAQELPRLPRDGSGEMFDRIARRYDLLNRLTSLGIDQSWRRKTVRSLELNGPSRVLDLATGTADLALLIAKMSPETQVVGLDPSAEMLRVGQNKVAQLKHSRVSLVQGDAQQLPFEDDSFDGITIAFGIRNVPDRAQALREMSRVCRRQGRVCILELSEPKRGLMASLARFHMHQVVPRLGALLSGAREYRYLPNSIAKFPPAEEFASLMSDSGLKVLKAEPLTFGVCHLYVAEPNKEPAQAAAGAVSR